MTNLINELNEPSIADLLFTLNNARVLNGKTELKSWKASKADLLLRIEQEQPAPEAPTPTEPDATAISKVIDFAEGDVIYDVDGNAYTVKNNKAVLNVENSTVSYFLGPKMKQSFTHSNPRETFKQEHLDQMPITKVPASAPELTAPAKRKAVIDAQAKKAVDTDTPTTVIDVKLTAKAVRKATATATKDTKKPLKAKPAADKKPQPQGKGEFALYLESIDMEGRVARAKLRRAKIAPVDGRYALTDAVKAALASDGRKKGGDAK